ncbi:MAG: DNA helicase RecQ [Alphaproteobacteria bacterium]|nr:DNA helicase RecQ [Alphaproteobacteria bacterium]
MPRAAKSEPSTNPQQVLSSVFGYRAFRGEQERIIAGVIAGESCCVLMPTGSGKSLCYQIPALCRPGTGIIVSPLIALMEDQVVALKELGIRAEAIHSALDYPRMRGALEALKAGRLDMVYVAPERLVGADFLAILDAIELSMFAIDEAHCISQWGHDFRPEYRQLALVRTRYPHVPCIAVTATADAPTRKDIVEKLALPTLYSAGFDRPNIRYEIAIKDNPRRQLRRFLDSRQPDESGIVYCLSRRKVDETARWLCDQGFEALPYHAGLDKEVRARNQERFLKDEGTIMVATIAFGMGVNKPDVRFVAHLDLPKNIEAYYQETGRAGRDGLPAVAWMVYGVQDLALQRSMIESAETPEDQKQIKRHKLNAFLGFCETSSCRRQVLLRYFDDSCAPCGNCDTCLTPARTIDGTIPAQKILSCIYRTKEMFGSGYIIDVLLGKDNERIRKFGHNRLSTYGIGGEHSAKEWQSLIRQLVARNLIFVDMDNHGRLVITEEGRQFIRTKASIDLRLDPQATGEAAAAAARTPRPEPTQILTSEPDKALFAALKALRLSIAKQQNVPPYVVFHDKTLIDMAVKRPTTLDALAMVQGVGESKLQKYGQAFLDIVKQSDQT